MTPLPSSSSIHDEKCRKTRRERQNVTSAAINFDCDSAGAARTLTMRWNVDVFLFRLLMTRASTFFCRFLATCDPNMNQAKWFDIIKNIEERCLMSFCFFPFFFLLGCRILANEWMKVVIADGWVARVRFNGCECDSHSGRKAHHEGACAKKSGFERSFFENDLAK